MPTVSVLIPCYNGARYVEAAVRSALQQTHADLEVVVVDDGSSDASAQVLQSITDLRLRYFHQDNRGLAATRNRLLELAAGEFVAFLDQDDLWMSERLARQLELFRGRPQLALAYADCQVIDAEGRLLGRWSQRNRFHRGDVFEELLQVNFIPLPTVTMRAAVCREVGPFQSYKISEEYDLFLKCAARYEVDYVEEPLACYRIHSGQFSRNYEIALEELRTIFGWWQASERGQVAKAALRRALATAYFNAGKNAVYLDGDGAKARMHFRRSLDEQPRLVSCFFLGLTFLGPAAVKRLRRAAVRILGTYAMSD